MISIYVHKYLRLAFGREPSKSESISGNDSIKPHQTCMKRNSFPVFSGVRKMWRALRTFPGLHGKSHGETSPGYQQVLRGAWIFDHSCETKWCLLKGCTFSFCTELCLVFSPDHKLLFFFFFFLCVCREVADGMCTPQLCVQVRGQFPLPTIWFLGIKLRSLGFLASKCLSLLSSSSTPLTITWSILQKLFAVYQTHKLWINFIIETLVK